MKKSDSDLPTETLPVSRRPATSDAITGAGLSLLSATEMIKFGDYLELILRWNERTNLTAVRDAEGIVKRHFVECIACAQAIPGSVSSLLDFGSGAGFPGIPIAICRPEIEITLAESQNKKAAFLLEAVRRLDLRVSVFSGRAEGLRIKFDCVTLRAVDKMERAVRSAANLINRTGYLAIMTTISEAEAVEACAGADFAWSTESMPSSDSRILRLGSRASKS